MSTWNYSLNNITTLIVILEAISPHTHILINYTKSYYTT